MPKQKFANFPVQLLTTERIEKIADALGTWEMIGKFFSGAYSSSIHLKVRHFISALQGNMDDDLGISDKTNLVSDLFYSVDRRLYKKGRKKLTMGKLMDAAKEFHKDYPYSRLLEEIVLIEIEYYDNQDTPEGSDDDMEFGQIISQLEGTSITKKKQDATKRKQKST